MTCSKKIWKTAKTLLLCKLTSLPKISLVEKSKLISDEFKVTSSCSNFFESAIESLGIKANKYSNESYSLNNTLKIKNKKWNF